MTEFNVNDRRESEFLDVLDEAVLDPARWPRALAVFADLVHGDGAALLSHSHSINVWSRVDPDVPRQFLSRWVDNPIQTGLDRLRRTPGGDLVPVISDWDLLPRSDFVRSEYFNEFMRPFNFDTLTMVTLASRDGYGCVNLGRSDRLGGFAKQDLERMASLQPALARSFWLSVKLAARDRVNEGLADFFDHSPHCVFLVGRDGQVLRANRAAEALVRAGDGVSVTRGRLRAPTPELTAKLHALIAAAGSGNHRGASSMCMPTPSRRFPLSVLVSAARSNRFADIWGARAVIVCMTDLEAGVSPPARLLRDLFGLTEAETRVALALFDGSSPREAAAALGLSFFTVRAHLARIFQKTDTHRQAELIRLFMRAVDMSGDQPPA